MFNLTSDHHPVSSWAGVCVCVAYGQIFFQHQLKMAPLITFLITFDYVIMTLSV